MALYACVSTSCHQIAMMTRLLLLLALQRLRQPAISTHHRRQRDRSDTTHSRHLRGTLWRCLHIRHA